MKAKIFNILFTFLLLSCFSGIEGENFKEKVDEKLLDDIESQYKKITGIDLNEEWSSRIAGPSYSSIANFNHKLEDYYDPINPTTPDPDNKLRTRHFSKVKGALTDLKEIKPKFDKSNKDLRKEIEDMYKPLSSIITKLDFFLKKDEWETNNKMELYKKWEGLKKDAKKLRELVDKF